MPEISVIIPTYNRKHLISRAIRSVLNQTCQNFELIVVDDYSADNTEEVVKSFKDERIIYIRHRKNKGGSAARNTGINIAKGDYIGFLDDDDEWLPGKLEKQISKFKASSDKVGVIYSGFLLISEKTGEIVSETIPTVRGNVYLYALPYCFVGGGSIPLVRKSCFQKTGLFDETLPSRQDWDMYLRLSKFYEFDFVPDILTKRYVHGRQITTNLNAKLQAGERIIRKHYVDLSKYPRIFSDYLNRIGILYCLAGNPAKGRRYFLKSIKWNPLQRIAYIHLFFSLAPGVHRNILKKHCIMNIGDIAFYF